MNDNERLTCDQKFIKTNLIYHLPHETRKWTYSEKTLNSQESVKSVRMRERVGLWWEGFVKEAGFEPGVRVKELWMMRVVHLRTQLK